MSALSKTALLRSGGRHLRIIALPITKSSGASSNKSDPLIYYHFQTPPISEDVNQISLAKKMALKAADMWAGFGKAPEGSWKLKTFRYGERLVDRIEFEELALKGLDPSVGPTLTKLRNSPVDTDDEKDLPRIPLVYPPSYISTPLLHLQSLTVQRMPRHKRGFWTWLLVSPLTAPVALIPIIPNLPFFFCIWRSWHHYRAYKASQYLEALLERGAIDPEPSEELDKIYLANASQALDSPSSSSDPSSSQHADNDDNKSRDRRQGGPTKGPLLLNRDAVPSILSLFDLPSAAAVDVYRALSQAHIRVQDAP